MTEYRYTAYPTPTTYLDDTDLASTADDGTVLGPAIDNSTDRDKSMRIQVELGSIDMSSESGPGARIRLIESIDGGTKYEDNDDQSYGITFPFAPGTAATAPTRISMLEIPPDYFKLEFVNETGQTLPTSGNAVTFVKYTDEDDTA